MKNLLLLVLLALVGQTRPDESKAYVNNVEGLFVFIDAVPASPYVILGQVEKKFAIHGFYEEQRNGLIKRIKKTYPTANGLIIDPSTDFAQAVLISPSR